MKLFGLLILMLVSTAALSGGLPITQGAMHQAWSVSLLTDSGIPVRIDIDYGDVQFNKVVDAEFKAHTERRCAEMMGEPCTVMSQDPMIPDYP